MENKSEEYTPKSLLNLKIKTLQDSSVFLLAVDQKFVLDGPNDISQNEVQKVMRNTQKNLNIRLFDENAFILSPTDVCTDYEKKIFEEKTNDQDLHSPKNEDRPIIRVNDDLDYAESSSQDIDPTDDVKITDEIIIVEEEEDNLLRKFFPDVWIDENIVATESTIILRKTLPDTITTWKLSAFAIHPEKGLSIAEPTSIKTTRNTYLEVKAPKFVRLGDVFKITFKPITSKNDLKYEKVMVSLSDHKGVFEYINKVPTDLGKCFNYTLTNRSEEQVTMGNYGEFLIQMVKDGQQKLTITAKVKGAAVDIVELSINVNPNGIIEYKSKDIFMELNDKNTNFTHNIKIDIPAGAKLVNIEASLDGNLLGSAINNFNVSSPLYQEEEDKLIKFGQAIIAHKYLNESGKLDEKIMKKIEETLDNGYMYILELETEEGAFQRNLSSSGNNIWFTSFVVQLLLEARNVMKFIDEDTISIALKYLVEKQEGDGSFPIDDEIPHFDQMIKNIGMQKNYITAFASLAFLKSPLHADKAEKALKFLNSTELKFDLDTSITAYAFAVAKKNEHATKFLKSVKQHYLTSKNPEKDSLFAEVASYTTLAGLKLSKTEYVIKNTGWLLNNKITMSHYDRLISNQAINEFLLHTSNKNSSVISMQLKINEVDKLLKIGKSHKPDHVKFTKPERLANNDSLIFIIEGSGNGMAVANIWYNYIIQKKEHDSFGIETETITKLNEMDLQVIITAKKNSFRTAVEIHLPSGYDYKSHEANNSVSMTKICI